MADIPPSAIRELVAAISLPARRALRSYRRMRWTRDPAWVARTRREPPLPDVILLAAGPDRRLALWEVQGPRDEYLLDLPGTNAGRVLFDFPSAGFTDRHGKQPDWNRLPKGRYWAILHAWEGDQRVPFVKVPFRVHEGSSRLARWYEARFMAFWERRFGGTGPDAPPPDPDPDE